MWTFSINDFQQKFRCLKDDVPIVEQMARLLCRDASCSELLHSTGSIPCQAKNHEYPGHLP